MTPDDPIPPLTPQRPRAITFRSVLLGLVGVLLICGLAPYNDYALRNTMLIGNNLPLVVVMLTFLLVLINAALNRFAPRWSFSAGEMTVAMAMTMVACAVPATGLMRYLLPSLVSPLWQSVDNHEYQRLLESLDLPEWIFPRTAGETLQERANDPVIRDYVGRVAPGEAVPYGAWLRPILGWGVFLMALYSAILCLVTLVHRQWVENERLAFPLAQIQLALVTPPAPRRLFNDLFSARGFWIAFGAIFLLQGWNGLATYWPKYFPEIAVYYDLNPLFSESPWVFADTRLKQAKIYFTAVGVTYFIPGAVALSLWFFFLLDQPYRMLVGTATGDVALAHPHEQGMGGTIAFSLAVIWIGRHHWALILRQAFRGHRPGEPQGRHLPYPFAFWALVAAVAAMLIWLIVAGCTLLGAAVAVFMLLFLFMFIARIIAETGLLHGATQLHLYKPWHYLALAGITRPVPVEDYYLTAMLHTHHFAVRESLSVYGSHAVRVADQTIFRSTTMQDDRGDRRNGRLFICLLLLTMMVAYVTSAASWLTVNYRHASSRDESAVSPINRHAMTTQARNNLLEPTLRYRDGRTTGQPNTAVHFAAGFGITAVLSWLRLHFAGWPLHPVGFLMRGTYPMGVFWLSIFLGWSVKVLILRLGGARLYQAGKPFFLGLIIGESLAAGFWLIMSIALDSAGIPYKPIHIMPG